MWISFGFGTDDTRLVAPGESANDYLVRSAVDHMLEEGVGRQPHSSHSVFMTPCGSHWATMLDRFGAKHTSCVLPRELLRTSAKEASFDALAVASSKAGAKMLVGTHPMVEKAEGLRVSDHHYGGELMLQSFLHMKGVVMVWAPDETHDRWTVSYAVFTAPPDTTMYHKDAVCGVLTSDYPSKTLPEDLPLSRALRDLEGLCVPADSAGTMNVRLISEEAPAGEARISALIEPRTLASHEVVGSRSGFGVILTPGCEDGDYARLADKLADIVRRASRWVIVSTEHADADHPVMRALLESNAPDRWLLMADGGLSFSGARDHLWAAMDAAGVKRVTGTSFTAKVVCSDAGWGISTANFVARSGRRRDCAFRTAHMSYEASVAEAIGAVWGTSAEPASRLRRFFAGVVNRKCADMRSALSRLAG